MGERLCNSLVMLALVARLEEGIWHHQNILVYPSAIKMGKAIYKKKAIMIGITDIKRCK